MLFLGTFWPNDEFRSYYGIMGRTQGNQDPGFNQTESTMRFQRYASLWCWLATGDPTVNTTVSRTWYAGNPGIPGHTNAYSCK